MKKTTRLATIVSTVCLCFWACGGDQSSNDVTAGSDPLKGSGKAAAAQTAGKRLKAKLLPPGVAADAEDEDTLHGNADYRERDGARQFKASAESPDTTTFVEGQSYPVVVTHGGTQVQVGVAEASCETTVTGIECELSLELTGSAFPTNFPATLDVGDTVDVGGVVSGTFK